MNRLFSKLSVFILISQFFISPGHAGAPFARIIRNDSSRPWIIVPRTHSNTKILFDSSPKRGPAACTIGSTLKNGPCLLPPGQTSYITFSCKKKCTRYPTVQGDLLFIDFTAELFKSLKVHFNGRHNGITMYSEDETKINDTHGDITIFDF